MLAPAFCESNLLVTRKVFSDIMMLSRHKHHDPVTGLGLQTELLK